VKAIRIHEFGPPEVMKWEEVPDPRPGAQQVVVRVGAVGVNPVETYIRSGAYARLPVPPFTPGNDAAGAVEAVGEGVERVKAGDRVFLTGTISGAYAEKALCLETQVHPCPRKFPLLKERASIPLFGGLPGPFPTGQGDPRRNCDGPWGHRGSGDRGDPDGQGLGHEGDRNGGTDKGRQLIAEQGAHQVFDHHAPGYLENALASTGGRGIDVIVELLANVNLGKDLTVLARGGRVVIVGSRGPVEINPRDAMARDGAILGMLVTNASEGESRSIHAALGAGWKAAPCGRW